MIRNNCPISGRSLLLYQFTSRVIKLTVVIIGGYHCYQFYTKILSNILLSRLSLYIDDIIRDHQCWFRCNRSTTDQIFCIHQVLKMKWEYNETAHQLFVDFKKSYDSVRRQIMYNILIEFGLRIQQVRVIKMCLKEAYSEVGIGKHLSDNFPIQNGLKQGDDLSTLIFNFSLEYANRKEQ
jgi:hypothetical protein